MAERLVTVGGRPNPYGALQGGFSFEISEGYQTLVGVNNSGKSAILQLAFATLLVNPEFGPERICLVPSDREFVTQSTETGGRGLVNYNQELQQWLNGAPLSFDNPRGPGPNELGRLLITHSDYAAQLARLNDLLARLGFPRFVLRTAQLGHFDDIGIQLQGSGLRALFPILCALTADLRVVLIDEPERALEPALQRALRDLLIDEAQGKAILVATHSHLMLHRASPADNFVVSRSGGVVSASPVATDAQLMDVVFRLLGNDTADLFFPKNFCVVEGASDQVIVERAVELLGGSSADVKVLAAGGIDRITGRLKAVVDALVPLIVGDSPYARRVVALVDAPSGSSASRVDELRRLLDDRLFVLPETELEAYIPEALYERAGRNRVDDLDQLDQARSDFKELARLKRAISTQMAGALTVDDLEAIPIIRDCAARAIAG